MLITLLRSVIMLDIMGRSPIIKACAAGLIVVSNSNFLFLFLFEKRKKKMQQRLVSDFLFEKENAAMDLGSPITVLRTVI